MYAIEGSVTTQIMQVPTTNFEAISTLHPYLKESAIAIGDAGIAPSSKSKGEDGP